MRKAALIHDGFFLQCRIESLGWSGGSIQCDGIESDPDGHVSLSTYLVACAFKIYFDIRSFCSVISSAIPAKR